MENMYIFASTLHPGSHPGMVVRAYDMDGSPTLIYVEDPSFTIVILWDDYMTLQGWIDSHSAVQVSKSKRMMWNGNRWNEVDVAVLAFHCFSPFTMMRDALSNRKVDILIDRWIVDCKKSASFISNIGLPCLCSWYAVDTHHAIADTKRGDPLPHVFSQRDKIHTSRFLHMRKEDISEMDAIGAETYPLKTVFLDLHTRDGLSDDSRKRKMEQEIRDAVRYDLGERFQEKSKNWKECPITIGGTIHRSETSDEVIDHVVVMYGNDTITLTLTTFNNDELGDKVIYSDEKHLLCDLSYRLQKINPDIIIMYDISDASTLQKRYESLQLDDMYTSIFAKLNGCSISVMDDDLLRCNHLISSNKSLNNMYHNSGGDLMRVKNLKQKLRSKTPQQAHVIGFGTAVLSAKEWYDVKGVSFDSLLDKCQAMMMSDQHHSHVQNFQYQVQMSGTNFVSYNGGASYVRPSEVYNLNVGKEMMASNLAVLYKMSSSSDEEDIPLQGGLVLDTHPGYRFDPIITLDFESMYASIIETFNYCFTTLSQNENDHTYPTIVDGVHCLCPKEQQGILPKILTKWKRMRSQIKESQRVAIDDDDIMKYAITEKAIKACIVSMIGQNMSTGQDAPFSNRFLANVITKTGRHILQTFKDIVPHFNHPALEQSPTIVAGDTDSYFIQLKLKDQPNSMKDLSLHFSKKINITKDVVSSLKDMLNGKISEIIHSWTSGLTKNHLHLKWEGTSFASILFPQKKRYVHWETDGDGFQIKYKGVTSIQSSAIPIEASLEEKALHIAICGWYLCMRRGSCYDYPDVVPPSALVMMDNNIISVFKPDHGWMEDVTIRMVEGEGIFQMFVGNTNQVWTRTFWKSANSMESCIDHVTCEIDEKVVRCLQVVELVRKSMSLMRNGHFKISDLLQSRVFRGFAEDGDRYCKIAATIARSRSGFGLYPPKYNEVIQYVKVDSKQETKHDWQKSLVLSQYVDPILVVREGLAIDVKWYMSRQYDMIIGKDSSLLAVMMLDIHDSECTNILGVRQDVKNIMDNISVTRREVNKHPLPPLPQGVSVVPINLENIPYIQLPKSRCLIGSVFDLQRVSHFYVQPHLAYRQEVIDFCECLSPLQISY